MRPTTLTLVCGVVILLLHTGDAIGGGGENPPTPGDKKTTGPAVSAIIVMDPHLEGLTHNTLTDGSAKAKQASIRLQKGTAVSGSTFRIPSSFLFTMFGCDVTKTNDRFVNSPNHNNKLINWIPSAIIDRLFLDLGITVTSTNVPVITDVDNVVCTVDPENPGTTPGPGILSFQAVIQFQVPK